MKKIAVIALLFLLAGCATERYYPVHLEGGGHYIAEREYPATGYGSLYALGMNPWWVHSFYSPYYYPNYFSYYHPFYDPFYGPYHFAGWYSSWPYHLGYQGRYSYGWPPYGSYRYRAPAQASGGTQPTQPGRAAPVAPTPPQVSDRQRRRAIVDSVPDRGVKFRGAVPQPKGNQSPAPQRVAAPPTAFRPKPPEALPRGAATRAASPPAAPQRERPFSSGPERKQRAPSERSPRDRDHQ